MVTQKAMMARVMERGGIRWDIGLEALKPIGHYNESSRPKSHFQSRIEKNRGATQGPLPNLGLWP
jgi:hypothetical protein